MSFDSDTWLNEQQATLDSLIPLPTSAIHFTNINYSDRPLSSQVLWDAVGNLLQLLPLKSALVHGQVFHKNYNLNTT